MIYYICPTKNNLFAAMENFVTPDKHIIISLIKDDLTNYRLVSGLEALGLDSDCYSLCLGETIFKLMGFPKN